ncbi:MAG: helix-turn-helix domain-containing protein [Gammaproteobacteria bacterium]|uniref:DNA-3-methyladenine glycosylase 2 family protein n=1 Tax=Rhodoferax sp. TaxID=50421 RepID=UPI0017C56F27|nr:AlkA N-terminal domain-containing protein [Rhodoferax sp.]MBU3898868.1 helix-turn-helix domain-containing protein [Gammaproteobacteria bacterium]MBA3059489.1 helix-turn-helix domain-containing protein [Rhodoferax sp.]MBU3999059.1 helix-turn-helix domain-containing protein [Gammaproteobacteria bacterium]MBU4019344.1 helix-turn-helix domain-containing protein [Gammaproteobacteria bacterium]MBU4081908.1 helix-turn-helix domain-containing protein [Gammaproteobacteria bacterium]
MTPISAAAIDDARYLALKAKDARFDGCFFTGVTSTGIYCRPVCRVRTPKRENCLFFSHAAQAERAGFRPCLRCRPELAPGTLALGLAPEARAWSMQDACSILAAQAARLLDTPEAWAQGPPSVAQLALRLGVSERHLRRVFSAALGVSPLQYLQTRRLLTAKQLLTDTALPVTEVAQLSGFASVRRFNAAFAEHYALNPSQLRRSRARGTQGGAHAGLQVRLAYRPPYDARAMLAFFATRQVTGIEDVTLSADHLSLRKTVAVTAFEKRYTGWIEASFDDAQNRVELRLSDSLLGVLPGVMARVRALLDLDADPGAINSLLHARFPLGDGLRVPGALDGFELAVRAVLGQQITVAAARTLATRLVARWGEPVDTPFAGLNRLFPTPAALADASGDALGELGIVKQRQAAIRSIASAVLTQRLQLHAGADVAATVAALKELPGVGDWTAQYIAMRALRWPDAFAAGDVALHRALGVQDAKNPALEALTASHAWQPWRSYALVRAWATLAPTVRPLPDTSSAII